MRLFRRASNGDEASLLRLYYASDIHGTEVLWKKFLNASKVYNAKVLVMGGDITGKMVIPIVRNDDGTWSATFHGRAEKLSTEADVVKLEERIRGNGMYPYRTTAAEVASISALSEEEQERWFEQVMLQAFLEIGLTEVSPERPVCGGCVILGTGAFLSIRSSRCATGIFTPWARKIFQIARLTSERTLLTPFIGSAIQKRTSMRMP